MTVKELYDGIASISPEEREKSLVFLFENYLSPICHQALQNFQDKFDYEKNPYDVFKTKQDELVKKCIDIELSEKGQLARSNLELKEFTWETSLV